MLEMENISRLISDGTGGLTLTWNFFPVRIESTLTTGCVVQVPRPEVENWFENLFVNDIPMLICTPGGEAGAWVGIGAI